jgi:hypothetical protein
MPILFFFESQFPQVIHFHCISAHDEFYNNKQRKIRNDLVTTEKGHLQENIQAQELACRDSQHQTTVLVWTGVVRQS